MRNKIISNEPKDYDKLILLIGALTILVFWGILGVLLSRTNEAFLVPLTTLILASVTVLATLQNEIRNWWYRPKLSLICGMDKGSYKVGNEEDFYIRVKVRNFGRGRAKNCYVKLINVIDPKGNVVIGDPINFRWASTHQENKDIAPFGTREFFDLFAIGKTNHAGYPKDRKIMVLLATLGKRFLEVGGSDYFVNLTLHSENQVKFYCIRICNNSDPQKIKVKDVTNMNLHFKNGIELRGEYS